jgi:hypothetical protein
MPWTAADADTHKKGLTKKQRRKWASIANAVFESCQDEAKAIKIACAKFDVPFNPVLAAAMEEKLKLMAAETKVPDDQPKLGEIPEMEIFRTGTHNGEPFDDKDLQEIVDNFNALKEEIRPKLKITHREKQESLAGLASYGDVMDVFIKTVQDGSKRLFARVTNVPKQVMDWIKDRRFPERSIELYSKVKLGTQKDSKIYRSVLKNIALLGAEMPAVSGMEPIKLSEKIQSLDQIICFGEVCFPCMEEAQNYEATLVSAGAIADMLARKY